ncbi:MAG: hypothetical protein U0796_06005 [Gemmatales bacterium]
MHLVQRYNGVMSALQTYRGFIRQGMIVPDGPLPFVEGTPVSFEVQQTVVTPPSRSDLAVGFQLLMNQWNAEDDSLAPEVQQALQTGLQENRGLQLQDGQLADLLR